MEDSLRGRGGGEWEKVGRGVGVEAWRYLPSLPAPCPLVPICLPHPHLCILYLAHPAPPPPPLTCASSAWPIQPPPPPHLCILCLAHHDPLLDHVLVEAVCRGR